MLFFSIKNKCKSKVSSSFQSKANVNQRLATPFNQKQMSKVSSSFQSKTNVNQRLAPPFNQKQISIKG